MSGSATTLVTPEGIRDGEPASLLGLCRRRAGSVLDYGLAVTTPDRAMEATAEAFARFRAAVVAADDPRSLNPETLLLGCTRHAAGALVPPAGEQEECAAIPMLIVDRLDGVISPHDVPRLGSHLIHCPACRRLDAAFQEAERIYRQPHRPELPAEVEDRVMEALRAAAPVTWVEEDAPVGVEPEPEPEPEPEREPEPAPPPAPVLSELPPVEAPPRPEPEALVEPEVAQPAPVVDDEDEHHEDLPFDDEWVDDEDAWVDDEAEETPAPEEVVTAVHPVVRVEEPAVDEPVVDEAAVEGPVAEGAAEPAARVRAGVVPRVVVPAAIVVLGATGAMAFAGVFGGREAEPARGTTGIPAPEPPALPAAASELQQERAAEAAREALERTRARERRLADEKRDEKDEERDSTAPSPPASSAPAPSPSPPSGGGSPSGGSGSGSSGAGSGSDGSGSGGSSGGDAAPVEQTAPAAGTEAEVEPEAPAPVAEPEVPTFEPTAPAP